MSPEATVVEIRITVQGSVQGVGFRWFAREAAVRLGIAGWVRNVPDGSVELEVRGAPPVITAFVDALREGPPRACVREVRTEPRASSTALGDPFQVLS